MHQIRTGLENGGQIVLHKVGKQELSCESFTTPICSSNKLTERAVMPRSMVKAITGLSSIDALITGSYTFFWLDATHQSIAMQNSRLAANRGTRSIAAFDFW